MPQELYRLADRLGHTALYYPFRRAASVAVAGRDGCLIGIDPGQLESRADERVKLAHELGHCETGTVYGRDGANRSRCEERANRWAYDRLLPWKQVRQALWEGDRTVDALAERFSVTEDFVRGALRYYRDARGLPI